MCNNQSFKETLMYYLLRHLKLWTVWVWFDQYFDLNVDIF